MPLTYIPFRDFKPGGSAFGVELSEAQNVLPLFGGLYAIPALANPGTTVATAPMTGAFAHLYPASGGTSSYVGDDVTIFAGSKTALYDSAAWTNLSKGGGYAAAPGDEPAAWRFASFGNDIWACNGLDVFQRRTNNAGNFADGPVSTFVPRPRFCAAVREFMVLGDLSANTNGFPDQITWSDINDATWYDDDSVAARPDSLSGGETGKRIVSRPGQITGLVGGSFGVIFKRNSIHVLQLTGGSEVWRIDDIDPAIGCALPGSLVAGRRGNYFFGGDGFYRQVGFSPAEKISPPEIDEVMVSSYNNSDRAVGSSVDTMAEEDALIISWESRKTGLIFWVTRTFDARQVALIYNTATGAWTEALLEDPEDNALMYIDCAVGLPQYIEASTTGDFLRCVLFTSVGPNARARTFSGSNYPARLVTKRVHFGLDAQDRPRSVRIKGTSPVFRTPRTLGSSTPLEGAAIQADVLIRASNTIYFEPQTDPYGASVSPRTEGPFDPVNEASDMDGFLPHNVVGMIFELTVTIPYAQYWTIFDGVWCWWEAV